ncbi:22445_t:CDS:2 [Dentiscutata erythropus]|uniref:22445_t:CDS:1 n=1 Tax=Dentiscutata erythropus TaxID=1348616 RepID=A0A9N8VDK6_9GLOM|nr:22445_t:CDS:2 [Dentiscutata erythropus]
MGHIGVTKDKLVALKHYQSIVKSGHDDEALQVDHCYSVLIGYYCSQILDRHID